MKKDSSSGGFISQATEQYGQFLKKFFSTSSSYKDLEAIRHSPDGSCYIPDRTGRYYTGEKLLEMSLGQKEIAEEMFLSFAGQDPDAWLVE